MTDRFPSALCRQTRQDHWFPNEGDRWTAEAAIRICRSCPHISDCLRYALSMDDNPFALADGALIPAGPAARKVRALIAIGWPRLAQAQHLGMRQSNFHYADWDDSYTITVRRDRDIDAMYRKLCMTPGGSVRARNEAQRKGWPPPLAWDDIDAGTLADTEEGAGCTRCDDIEHLLPFESPVHIATRLGYTSPTIAQHLRRHGRPDLAARFERTNQKESA